MEIDIFLNKSVEENAAIYYEKAKKAKKKIAGAEQAISKFKRLLDDEIERQNQSAIDEEKKQITTEKRKSFWFEKFRWFFSTNNVLVIGGRDATSNEMIIKKHTQPGDIIFHTDMAGSPFFVPKPIKENGEKVTEETISEIGDATCSFSRAWKNGLTTTSVFYVGSEQVTKEANTGEYLTKGAFVIRGKVNYVDNKIDLSIGIIKKGEYAGTIMCAPHRCIEKHCGDGIKIAQGDEKQSDIAKLLKKLLGTDASIDNIIRVLPPGNIKLVKERSRSGQK